MQSTSVSTTSAGYPRIEIDAALRRVTWHSTGDDSPAVRSTVTVPWFDEIGVLDYASADRPTVPHPGLATSATCPVFGDPLIVRPDLAAVFWRVGSVLHTAPIRSGRVEFINAAAVDWSAPSSARAQFAVIEHNLAQCCTLPTLDPPLHVVQVDTTGRMSFAFLLADADGSPVIGPTPHHFQPWLYPKVLAAAAQRGLSGLTQMWEDRLKLGAHDDGDWRFVPPSQVLATLAEIGFTVAGPPAERPGLVAAFSAAQDRQWAPGWYGGTRAFALARFRRPPNGGDFHYDFHRPGSRRVAGTTEDGHELSGWQGPADVETLPGAELVRLEAGYPGGGRSLLAQAGDVALHEPVLISGTLPVIDHEVSWSATCRRCRADMTCSRVGRWDFVPYVDELTPRRSASLWCSAHPQGDRLRPHAPVYAVTQRPTS